MILKRYNPGPKSGDIKTINHFAWLPTRINDTLIWLEWYNKQVEYTATKHINMGIVEWPCIHIQEEGWSFINESRGKHRGMPRREKPISPPLTEEEIKHFERYGLEHLNNPASFMYEAIRRGYDPTKPIAEQRKGPREHVDIPETSGESFWLKT